MALVAAKCTQCGQNLEVDSTQEAAICPYCKTEFITEKAITNYNTTYNIGKIDHADIHINDEKSVENRLKGAEEFLTVHKDTEKARQKFAEVADDVPGDYRGWWGLARVNSQEFAYTGCGAALFAEIEKYVTYALNVAPSEIRGEMDVTWHRYVQQVEKYNAEKQSERSEYVAKQNALEVKKDGIQKKILETQQKMKKKQDAKYKKECKIRKAKAGRYVIGLAVGIGAMVGYVMLGIPILLVGLLIAAYYGLRLLGWILVKTSINSLQKEIEQQQGIARALQDEMQQTSEAISEAVNEIRGIDKVMA